MVSDGTQFPMKSRAWVFGVLIGLSVLTAVGLAFGQSVEDVKPTLSEKPFTAEQLAVYRTVFSEWFRGDKAAVNLAVQSTPVDPNDKSTDNVCLKGLSLEPIIPGQVHRFREEDSTKLGLANLRFVDPEKQLKEIAENDPGKAIREGKSVDDAVKNGFAHGMTSISEIQFDRDHTHAVVSMSHVCGRLCGSGRTILLEKKNGVWTLRSQCGGWMS